MKKFFLAILLSIVLLNVNAQFYETLYVEEMVGLGSTYCADDENLLGIIIYGTGCPDQTWTLKDGFGNIVIHEENVDSIVVYNPHEYKDFNFFYEGCNNNIVISYYGIEFITFGSNPFNESIVWKRQNEYVILECGWETGYWSTGEIGESIGVSEPGIYSVTLTNPCGPVTYYIEVRDNVELYRATCDLVSNLNQVTWNTTPEQAEYVSAVKVYRNNQLVGTVPYSDGVFTDEIGSENTQWQYHIVAVSVEGDDCPIPSYWKRTIHLDCVQDSQGKMILQWTPYAEESPSKNEVTAYGIYDVVNGVPNHVIDVGNFTNVYAYNPADFHGYGAVAAVFAEDSLKRSDGFEKLAFSNRTKQMLGIDDIVRNSIRVYPNPTDGEFTVEGVSDLTIYNILGQVVTKSHTSDNVHKFSLGSGIYFIKSAEGLVKKVIVE